MIVSIATVISLALAAGFTQSESQVLTCVVEYESSFNTKAVHVNDNGTIDEGLLQINDHWWGETCKDLNLFDAADNIECGHRIFVISKRKFTPWIGYRIHKKECDERGGLE